MAKPTPAPKCKHGNTHYRSLCVAQKEVDAGRVCKHGTPFYCGFCNSSTPAEPEVARG